MDGSLAVYYKGQCLATKSAPLEAPVLRARNTTRFIPGGARAQKPVYPEASKTPKSRAFRPP